MGEGHATISTCFLPQHGDHTPQFPAGLFFQPALPDGAYTPSFLAQHAGLPAVAGHIAVQLPVPEGSVDAGPFRAAMRAAVPETAMHEHGDTPAHEGDVGAARRLGVVQAVATHSMGREQCTQGAFRPGIAALDPAHHRTGTGVGRDRRTAVTDIGPPFHGTKQMDRDGRAPDNGQGRSSPRPCCAEWPRRAVPAAVLRGRTLRGCRTVRS